MHISKINHNQKLKGTRKNDVRQRLCQKIANFH